MPVAPHRGRCGLSAELAGGNPFLIAEIAQPPHARRDRRTVRVAGCASVKSRAPHGRARPRRRPRSSSRRRCSRPTSRVDELAAAAARGAHGLDAGRRCGVRARPATELAAVVLLRAPAVSRSARRRSLRDQAARRDVRVGSRNSRSPSADRPPRGRMPSPWHPGSRGATDPAHHDRARVGRRAGGGRVPRAEPRHRGLHPLLDAGAGRARRRLVLPRRSRPRAALHRPRRADERGVVGGVDRRVRGRVPARVRPDRARRGARGRAVGARRERLRRSPTRSTPSKSS